MKGLILFDVDKTLIKSSTGHEEAFSIGFKEVYNIDSTINIINHYGMTDQQIIIEVLKKKGLKESEIRPKIKECMKAMLDYFDEIKDTIQIEILDGVIELLEELKKQNFLIGLVTGNLEPIGRGKMKKANLNHYFKLGGFGSDNINRAELVKFAIKRAEKNFNFKYDNNVFLFGDTPQDMNAGHEAGITTIGVTTGIYTKEDLKNFLKKHKTLITYTKDVNGYKNGVVVAIGQGRTGFSKVSPKDSKNIKSINAIPYWNRFCQYFEKSKQEPFLKSRFKELRKSLESLEDTFWLGDRPEFDRFIALKLAINMAISNHDQSSIPYSIVEALDEMHVRSIHSLF